MCVEIYPIIKFNIHKYVYIYACTMVRTLYVHYMAHGYIYIVNSNGGIYIYMDMYVHCVCMCIM